MKKFETPVLYIKYISKEDISYYFKGGEKTVLFYALIIVFCHRQYIKRRNNNSSHDVKALITLIYHFCRYEAS